MSGDNFKPISQDEYNKLFEVSADKPGDTKTRQERALDYALDIRKFEIGLYWKRAGYFWTFIAAALAGFIVVQRDGGDQGEFLAVVLGCIGFVFSLAWYCVNKGSKHWQENWENHVDLLEDAIIGPLYKVVTKRPEIEKAWWHPKGIWQIIRLGIAGPFPFSVSKINQIVSLFVIALWVVLVFHALPPFDRNEHIDWKYAFPIVVAVIASVMLLVFGRTDTKNYKGLRAFRRITTIEKPAIKNSKPPDSR
jgi:hypothetical protein